MWVCSSREQSADDAVIWACLKSSAPCVLTLVRPVGVCSCCFCAGCCIEGVIAGKLHLQNLEVRVVLLLLRVVGPVLLGRTLLVRWESLAGGRGGGMVLLLLLESRSQGGDAAGGTRGMERGSVGAARAVPGLIMLVSPSVNENNVVAVTFKISLIYCV